MSARIPVTTEMGALAKMPTKRRKTRKAGQLGARAQASVHIVKRRKVRVVMPRRPNCSLRGAQRMGPGEILAKHLKQDGMGYDLD